MTPPHNHKPPQLETPKKYSPLGEGEDPFLKVN